MAEDSTQNSIQVGNDVNGTVSYIMPYGAMVNIGLERDALLHISQFGRRDFRNVKDVYKVGDSVEAFVLKVDNEDRVALTLEKPPALPWSQIRKGESYKGTVTRVENYGAFVDIGAERPGMVHVSELTDGFVENPTDVVNVGDEVDVRVLKLNRRNRQIDLSMKTPMEEIAELMEPTEDVPSAMELAFRKAERRAKRNNNRDKQRRERNY